MNVEGWSVLIESVVGSDEPMEQWANDLLDVLADGTPAVSAGPNRVAVSISVPAWEITEAINIASEQVSAALSKVGLNPNGLVHIEAVEAIELDRQLTEPAFPVIVGVAEIADHLGVSKQRVSELARTETFSRPVANLAAGPVWAESMFEQFIEGWHRRPGQPPSTVIND